MDSTISLRPLPDYVIRESSECCCGFRDFIVAIAGSCDQRVSQSVAVDSAILLRPLPDYVISQSEVAVDSAILLRPLPDYVIRESVVLLWVPQFRCSHCQIILPVM